MPSTALWLLLCAGCGGAAGKPEDLAAGGAEDLPAPGDLAPVDLLAGESSAGDAGTPDLAPCTEGAPCPGGGICCNATCVDPMADPKHCGGCGKVCPPVVGGRAGCKMGECGVGSCQPPMHDCDGRADNGCETNGDLDARNCGGCGMVCPPAANGTAGCAGGVCGVGACDFGWADCNGSAADGCEVNLGTDPKHCHKCGTVCPSPKNAVASCDPGMGCVFGCLGAFRDCNGAPLDGCEVDSTISLDHCGGCGKRCAPANATGSCAGGRCAIASCVGAFRDCDQDAASGCEVDTAGDAKHCGACGKTCPVPANSSPTCAKGACGFACLPGFADCNGDAKDGCEIATDRDPMNCGGCAKFCKQDWLCCSSACVAPAVVRDGTQEPMKDLFYQFSSVKAGEGVLRANWDKVAGATGYEVAAGTKPGGEELQKFTAIGDFTDHRVEKLTLEGAWAGKATYHVTVRVACTGGHKLPPVSSDGVRIAEAALWDGRVANLRAPDAAGGHSVDWPENGVDAVYGAHYFETVDIGVQTVVRVQGWGKVDNVQPGVTDNAPAVIDPKDGWLEVNANAITVAGTITASGRGYGGGGGGARGQFSEHPGTGGAGGLGGASPNGAGGGSPSGPGAGKGTLRGGGGGGGGGGDGGSPGAKGPAGIAGDVGGTGVGTAGGAGEFDLGGGGGGGGVGTAGGGGGGGTGGGGGAYWTETFVSIGGGGGGSGGSAVLAAGPFGGRQAGQAGGYRTVGGNGDASGGQVVWLGAGGAGGATPAGGGGGAGGGAIRLRAAGALGVVAGARLLANGAGAGAGTYCFGPCNGGAGGGGGILLEARTLNLPAQDSTNLSARGGGGSKVNGGTIKLFYCTRAGALPTNAGRIVDAGAGSAPCK